uniref:Uncharacterized protein n=1 Tax=Cryptomonas curvata TaxID=233186 RepID=A0A7S0NCS5_9CRYP
MCLTAVAFLKETLFSNSGAPNFESVELVMGTGHDVFIPLQTNERVHYGKPRRQSAETLEAALKKQKNFDLDHNMAAHADWHAAGGRGRFLGTVKAPQVEGLVERAAADCGSDPDCVCDWAGTPHAGLFAYCCGTIVHNLGQTRGDYQAGHLRAWQAVCAAEQTYYSARCSRHALPDYDSRRH